jgi:hypothetical protein
LIEKRMEPVANDLPTGAAITPATRAKVATITAENFMLIVVEEVPEVFVLWVRFERVLDNPPESQT